MIIINSIRQLLRTPLKTLLFIVLILLSTIFVSIGTNLWLVSGRNIRALDESFVTIGTVQQKPNIVQIDAQWDASIQEYSYVNRPVYDREIPISFLYFEQANYLQPPERRPYYGAYHESYVTSQSGSDSAFPSIIIEAVPLENCIPSKPVKLRVKQVLMGNIPAGEILFCDHFNSQPKRMYADRTYVLSLQYYPLSYYRGFETASGFLYVPSSGITSTQYNENGMPIIDRYTEEDDGWAEVTPGYYNTPQGQRWFELIEAMEKTKKTIPVVPTNATYLLMDFFRKEANIVDGRDITEEEYAEGRKVCLVSYRFANNNKMKPGDSFPIPLYFANYRNSVVSEFSSDGFGMNWGLLNAQGKQYPVFEDSDYTIVGVYDAPGTGYSFSDFDTGENMVIIPTRSVHNSSADNIVAYAPMRTYNTSFQIPNGSIESYIRAMNVAGVEGLDITFYDNGYTQLKDGFDRIRVISMLLMTVGTVATLLAQMFFTYLFIIKNKKRTAIERSLGFEYWQCTISLLSGIVLLYILGIGSGSIIARNLCNRVPVFIAALESQSIFDLRFSSWVNNADTLVQTQFDLQSVGMGMYVLVALIMFIIGAIIAIIAISHNLKYEPLILLSTHEED